MGAGLGTRRIPTKTTQLIKTDNICRPQLCLWTRGHHNGVREMLHWRHSCRALIQRRGHLCAQRGWRDFSEKGRLREGGICEIHKPGRRSLWVGRTLPGVQSVRSWEAAVYARWVHHGSFSWPHIFTGGPPFDELQSELFFLKKPKALEKNCKWCWERFWTHEQIWP